MGFKRFLSIFTNIQFLSLVIGDSIYKNVSIPLEKLTRNEIEYTRRIMNGAQTAIDVYPYVAQIEYKNMYICAGGIISETVVITAQQCIFDSHNRQHYNIRVGSSIKGSLGYLFEIREFIFHPSYNPTTMDFDVALIVIDGMFELGEHIEMIRLPYIFENIIPPATAKVLGWGISNTWNREKELQALDLSLLPDMVCQVKIQDYTELTYRHLCAIPQALNVPSRCAGKEMAGPCFGDSGGPLISLRKLHGLVSWKLGNCSSPYPFVFLRIVAVRQWIYEQIET